MQALLLDVSIEVLPDEIAHRMHTKAFDIDSHGHEEWSLDYWQITRILHDQPLALLYGLKSHGVGI